MRGAVVVILLVLVGVAVGQVPPGFEVVQVTTADGLKSRPDINNNSVVMWSARVSSTDTDVFAFAHGIVRNLGSPDLVESSPRINDLNDFVAKIADSLNGPFDFAMYRDHEIVLMFDTNTAGYGDINNRGQVVWLELASGGVIEIVTFDGTTTHYITDDGLDNQMPRLNESGAVVFQTTTPDGSIYIRLYHEGKLAVLTAEDGLAGTPDLNDMEQLVWLEIGEEVNRVVLYEDGRATIVAEGPYLIFPRINNNSDIVYGAWNAISELTELVLHTGEGNTYVLPTLGLSAGASNINDSQEITWHGDAKGVGDAAIVLLLSPSALEPATDGRVKTGQCSPSYT